MLPPLRTAAVFNQHCHTSAFGPPKRGGDTQFAFQVEVTLLKDDVQGNFPVHSRIQAGVVQSALLRIW
jgi:hypothetical protein